jgi:hypothetical protein
VVLDDAHATYVMLADAETEVSSSDKIFFFK